MTLQPDSPAGYWIGYQILFAAGIGMSLEQCNVAVQRVLPSHHLPVGMSLTIFARSLAGTFASALGQNVFQSTLAKELGEILPVEDFQGNVGVTAMIDALQRKYGRDVAFYEEILRRVNFSVTRCFMVVLVMACLSLPCAALVEWKSVGVDDKERVEEEDCCWVDGNYGSEERLCGKEGG
ncbi:uncharacterized protein RCC_09598 [Ramularia collo-cygni]|uniref:Major facilitator superfamily (MFS) profile domain-containing protein n=1 Tax=Ramularia collo-cygni TaxID=112498 RepID=A0A2D3V7B7_9PEZI|nr:uncharacterized protein RCC_09598 [Ramularia collo-cygni]CZT23883.1 uncharacterized protein RCC_09598 [Ramularia collo-cygni]